jgi:hypothetical protein
LVFARSRAGMDLAPDYSHGRPESNGGQSRFSENKPDDFDGCGRTPFACAKRRSLPIPNRLPFIAAWQSLESI